MYGDPTDHLRHCGRSESGSPEPYNLGLHPRSNSYPDPGGMATVLSVPSVDVGDLPPIFTRASARALGISDRTLYRWRDDGRIEQLARGIFTQPDLPADPDLIEIAVRAPDATLCLSTALARHGLSDDIPPAIDVALPRHQRSPQTRAPVTWHRFDQHTFTLGRGPLTVFGDLRIGLYDPARTIIDAFRLRHLYGEDQAIEALRRWLAQPGNHPTTLLALARHFPTAEPPLRRVLQVLL
jgi:hypothetical protein